MKEDLALNHLVLTEARKLLKQEKNNINNNASNIEKALLSLIGSLKVDYDHRCQVFLVKANIDSKEVFLEEPKQNFSFYKRADLPNKEASVKVKEQIDSTAYNNAQKACELIANLLSQASIDTSNLALNKTLSSNTNYFTFLSNIDKPAWLIVLLIAFASAYFTWYQGTHTFDLLDNTYILETSWRIANGEIPYKDFTLVVTPGTFLVQAVLMKLFSGKAIVVVYWCMFVMFVTILTTYKILIIISVKRWLAVGLCLIPAFAGTGMLPFISYDIDTVLLCLFSIGLLLVAEKKDMPVSWMLPVGFLATLPLIFKQNMGLAHLVMIIGIVNLIWFLTPWRYSFNKLMLFSLGIILGLAVLILPFWYFGAVSDLLHNVIVLPAKLRLKYSIIGLLWDYFPVPVNFIEPVIGNVSSAMLWGALAVFGFFWFAGTHKSLSKILLPLWVFGITLANFMAQRQQSLVPLYPLFAMLLGLISIFVSYFSDRAKKITNAVIIIFAIFLALYLIRYSYVGNRLNFYEDPFLNPTPFKSLKMEGLRASPKIVKRLDEIISFIDKIPKEETFALVPTEDPLYFATNRRSPLRIVQSFPETGGDPVNYLLELKRVKPDWILQKTKFQFFSWKDNASINDDWLTTNYEVFTKLDGYIVWKKINAQSH